MPSRHTLITGLFEPQSGEVVMPLPLPPLQLSLSNSPSPPPLSSSPLLPQLSSHLSSHQSGGVGGDSASVSHLDKVECLFARDWTLGAAELRSGPIGVAPPNYRFTWTAGWWIDRLVGMFAHDISPLSQHEKSSSSGGAASRVGLPSRSELHRERERYEMEVRRQHGQSGRLGEAIAGHHGLLRLRSKA